MYLASPPPGIPTYDIQDADDLQEEMGLYDGNETLPELSDPLWDSPLGREVLRSAMAQRRAYPPLSMVGFIFHSNDLSI